MYICGINIYGFGLSPANPKIRRDLIGTTTIVKRFGRTEFAISRLRSASKNEHLTIPHKKARSEPEKYGDRYVMRGVSDGDRKPVIIVQYLGSNWVRPITAWDDRT